jgi:ABC-type amino acid transport substrate-binding protein
MKTVFKSAMIACIMTCAFIPVSSAKTYFVGVENLDYYPHYTHQGGQYKGFARDVLDEFAKQKGYVFEYKILPIKRLYNDFVEGKVDLKYPDCSDWQKDLKKGVSIHYSNAVVDYIDGVMVVTSNKMLGVDKLHVLGTVLGFTPWVYQDAITAGKIKLHENKSFPGLLQQVILKRIDGAFVNIAVANYQLNDVLKKPGLLVFDPNLPHIRGSYYFSTIKHPEVIDEFNSFLNKNKEMINALKKKYNLNLAQ